MNYFELVKDLADESYYVRESSANILIAFWPLSRGAILIGKQSDNPEIRTRCIEIDAKGANNLFGKQGKIFLGIRQRGQHEERIKWLWKVQPEFVNFKMVDFCLEDNTGKRMQALYLFLCPFETGKELPHLPKEMHEKVYKDEKLIIAACDLINYSWQRKNGIKVWNFDQKNPQHMINGINNARQWIRGLNVMHYGMHDVKTMNKNWIKIKDPKYKFFAWDFPPK